MAKLVITAIALTTLLTAIFVVRSGQEKPPLRLVQSVDLERYSGVWYEIARLPNKFQEKCVGDVTATYTVKSKDRLKVVNQCRKKNGELTTAEGVARRASDEGPNSRLQVRFAPSFLSFLPFVWGDYQIIELAPDYSYALVGEPGRKYLWILSRSPQMDEATYIKLKDAAAAQGFDVTRLSRTKHG
jgi:apolipoprotein D and lipocalin family protein